MSSTSCGSRNGAIFMVKSYPATVEWEGTHVVIRVTYSGSGWAYPWAGGGGSKCGDSSCPTTAAKLTPVHLGGGTIARSRRGSTRCHGLRVRRHPDSPDAPKAGLAKADDKPQLGGLCQLRACPQRTFQSLASGLVGLKEAWHRISRRWSSDTHGKVGTIDLRQHADNNPHERATNE